ncbi:MAG: DNA polymerase I [Candidatus Uhrbacteria bacterium]|nr:DNA polymerase I [Candidatus Uhrbacteria bacterium]
MKRLVILDGNALLHRAWHAIPPLTANDGRIVNAAYGFTNVVEKMRADLEPDYMVVAWDLPGATFRHEEYKEYKGTREKKEQELYDQIDYIKEILNAYGIPSLTAKGMEADDIIATIAEMVRNKKDFETLVVTGDMDALQLVDDSTHVIAFIKGLSETKEYDINAVEERYGLVPNQLIDFKALMGDPSDNIPGIAGIGKKTAAELVHEYGSIEGIENALKTGKLPEKYAKKLEGQEKNLEQMKRLVTMVRNVDLGDFKIADSKISEPNVEKLTGLFREYGFKRLLLKYDVGVSPAKAGQEVKKRLKEVALIEDLDLKTLVIYVDSGQADLFGGSIRSIALHDGESTSIIDSPQKEDIKKVIDVICKSELLIGHDLKSVFHQLQVESNKLKAKMFDTQIASYLLAPGTRGFDLATVAYEKLHKVLKDTAGVADKVQAVYELRDVLQRELEEEGMEKLAGEIEMPLVSILYQMECNGIEVNPKKLEKLSIEFEATLKELTVKIYKHAGHEFNINSPSQLSEILFTELGLPTKGIKKTKTGISTAASELEKLWNEHEIIPLMSEYRELAKLKSTYVDTLPKLIAKDGRIHTSYNQTVTATGRLSSSDPNLQNIPTRTKLGNEIRKAFVAAHGKVLVSADYSQFELRLAAVMAKDISFIKAFKDGADIHVRTAAEVLGIAEADVSKAERSAAKAINFGILYGMGQRNLARSTGMSEGEAKNFIDRYFDVHPGIQAYIDEMKLKAHSDEYVETLFGRKRFLPDINSGVQMLVAASERMAMNMPIQGTQADLLKMAMIQVDDWIQAHDYDVKMLLQVHDELVFEIAELDLDKVVGPIREIMVNVYQFEVPLLVDIEVGKNWGEMKGY